jgi:2-iminobutanoate/2-iminopropanoate deaminase
MAPSRLRYVSNVTGVAAGSSGVADQTNRALERAGEALLAGGSSLAHAVAATVYLRDASDFAAMNDAYRRAWSTDPPTRTTLISDLLEDGARVQMSFVGVPAGAERVAIHPRDWAQSPNPYSYAIRSGDTVWCSGLIPRDARDHSVVIGDTAVQTRAVLRNAGVLLAAAGLTHGDVASARVVLADIAEFRIMTAEYGRAFGGAFPARATVQMKLTSAQYRVEMTFVASRAARRRLGDRDPANPTNTPAVRAGHHLYVAGIPGASAADVLRRLDDRLALARQHRGDIEELIVYLQDLRTWADVRAAFVEYFEGAMPACTVVRADLAAGFTLEIMATAHVDV